MDIVNWNYINARKQVEKSEGFDLFSSKQFQLVKKKRGANSPITEQRELLAKLLNRTIPFICGHTRGFTDDELYQLRKKAESFTKNPQALAWKLLKEAKSKKKNEIQRTEKVGGESITEVRKSKKL